MQSAKTKSEAGILVLVVFVLGILVGGVGYRLWGARVFGSTATSPMRGPQGRGGPQPWSVRLGLSPDQQKQLDAIFSEGKPQFDAIQAQMQPLQAQWNALRMQNREKVRAILTPDQQAKFDEMMKQEDARGRGRGPGGPPPGGGNKPGQGPHGGPGF